MKLFMKHQLPYLVVIALTFSLFISLIWLDGYRKINILIYGSVLCLFLWIIFLSLSWFRQRNLYQLFSKQTTYFEELSQDSSELSNEIYHLISLEKQRHYQDIKTYKNKMNEHQTFMYEWVHQMKTPLSIMELMIEEEELDKASLLEETDRIKEGLNLALNMARLDSFSQDFIIEQVDLRKIAIEVMNEQKRHLIRNEIFPKVIIAENLMIETDKKWLNFCLTQIILNSIKYTEPVEKRLLISSEETETEVKVSIKDYGIGISKVDLPRIFNPFFTGKTGRITREATGMGLYLVKQVCQKLTHTLTVESELNEGTQVTIHFQKRGSK
ncbi:MAG TPA: sensor histidine kinase [Vagococcus sp.]|uniref:histidine kinase n=2 Tax=Enterococcaceae TaxID=81852 RepID=A0A1X6WNT0_9ENTE|nr:Two-component sensor kinase YvcQ [Vagococcus fluvialis bH819]HCM88297.1 sensor histidine kinase [Vagococcus sp.]